GREGRERRRGQPLDEVRQQRSVLAEKLKRLVVERGEPMAEQSRLAIRHDRGDQLVARDFAMEDVVDTEVHRQRNENEIVGGSSAPLAYTARVTTNCPTLAHVRAYDITN